MRYLEREQERLKDNWANAAYVSSHDKADVYQNAGAIAACSVLRQVRDVGVDDLYGDSDE